MLEKMLSSSITPICDTDNFKEIELLEREDFNIDNFFEIDHYVYKFMYVKGFVAIDLLDITKEILDVMQLKTMVSRLEERFNGYIKNKDYSTLLMMINKPYRISCYKRLFNDIPNEDKYEVFKDIYVSSEYGFQGINVDFFREITSYKKKEEFLTDYQEDDLITVYRGQCTRSTPYRKAYSWTLSLETAKFFATRFSNKGKIYSAKIKKKDIIDYITDRGEEEVLLLAENLIDIKEEYISK